MCDEKTILPFVLEQAVAIAIMAILLLDDDALASLDVNGVDIVDELANFGTIGSDILHG